MPNSFAADIMIVITSCDTLCKLRHMKILKSGDDIILGAKIIATTEVNL